MLDAVRRRSRVGRRTARSPLTLTRLIVVVHAVRHLVDRLQRQSLASGLDLHALVGINVEPVKVDSRDIVLNRGHQNTPEIGGEVRIGVSSMVHEATHQRSHIPSFASPTRGRNLEHAGFQMQNRYPQYLEAVPAPAIYIAPMAFNPLAAFDNLRNAGFDETQARAITQTSEMAREGMATVTDLLAMEARLKEHNWRVGLAFSAIIIGVVAVLIVVL